jgi:competence protein ComFC
MASMNVIDQIVNPFLELLAPRHCEVCGSHIGDEYHRFTYMCEKCADRLPVFTDTDLLRTRIFENFDKDDVSLTNVQSLFSLKSAFQYMELIHSLKYYGKKRIGYELGLELGQKLMRTSMNDHDAIIPIPIHHARKRERGYNQSFYISKAVSEILEIPVQEHILKRERYTKTQTLLSSYERKINVSSVFQVNPKYIDEVRGKKFLLIDDVITTGSTFNHCGMALLEAGAIRVDAAALASA